MKRSAAHCPAKCVVFGSVQSSANGGGGSCDVNLVAVMRSSFDCRSSRVECAIGCEIQAQKGLVGGLALESVGAVQMVC